MMHMDMHTTVRVQCPIGRMPASNAHCISGICDVHMYVHYVCMQCTYYGYRTVTTPPPSERTVSMQHAARHGHMLLLYPVYILL